MLSSRARNTRRRQVQRLLAFSFANADLVLELDERLEIAFASGAVHGLTGRNENALAGMSFLNLVTPEDRGLVACALMGVEPGARLCGLETALATYDGTIKPVVLSACRFDDPAPRRFITLRRRAIAAEEAELRARADKQTGLLPESDFAALAARLQASRPGVQLTMIDFSDFEEFSNRIDPKGLEKALGAIGRTLQAAAVDQRTAARLDAGKLGLVHDPAIDLAALRDNLHRIGREADPSGAGLDVRDWTLPLQDVGLKQGQVFEVLRYAIRRFAERGLDEFRPDSMHAVMQTLVKDTVNRLSSLQDTIGGQRIEIAYQPIVTMHDRQTHHWEAFSRPIGGKASPESMVRFTEQIGLSAELDLLICSKVIQTLEAAAASGVKPVVAVNFSALSVQNDLFLQAFLEMMETKPNLRPQLMIEITETTKLDDLAVADNIIQQFRRLGHKVCLDDFGAGACGIPYVQRLDVDYIKIDGGYVENIARNARDAAIVRALARMCAELDVGLIAECVETEEQAGVVSKCGVRLAQGFLFGRPDTEAPFAPKAARPPLNLRRKGYIETWQ